MNGDAMFETWWAEHSSGTNADGPWSLNREGFKQIFLDGVEVGVSYALEVQWEKTKDTEC